jgi:acyl dehydratase
MLMVQEQSDEAINARIDEFYEKTEKLVGEEVQEGEPWNTQVNSDQAGHYLNGISDINPRWDPEGPGQEVQPTYLTSVVYPLLHGEPMEAPLASLIAGVDYEWYEPIEIGDDLEGTSVIKDLYEKGDRDERRYIFIISEVTYTRNGEEVGKAEGTMIRATQRGNQLQEEREIYTYSDEERAEIEDKYEAEIARLESVPETPDVDSLEVGDELPSIVRGPLTIADMVCWNAGRGPTYGASAINYMERKGSPHNTVPNPEINWMQKTSHQHEDPYLCEQRGMALPFGNGVMMYCWTSPLVTNWMGADGFLKEHNGQLRNPYYYGDTLDITGEITDKSVADDTPEVTVEWEAIDPHGEPVVVGDSVVSFPNQ